MRFDPNKNGEGKILFSTSRINAVRGEGWDGMGWDKNPLHSPAFTSENQEPAWLPRKKQVSAIPAETRLQF